MNLKIDNLKIKITERTNSECVCLNSSNCLIGNCLTVNWTKLSKKKNNINVFTLIFKTIIKFNFNNQLADGHILLISDTKPSKNHIKSVPYEKHK